MSNFALVNEKKEIQLSIPEAFNENGITYYQVYVDIDTVHWSLQRRYKDFLLLHESILDSGVPKESFPPKKYIGNKDPSFILNRRRKLEEYIVSAFSFLRFSLPTSFAEFLDFHKYDINYILRNLASQHLSFSHDSELMEEGNNSNEVSKPSSPKWSPLTLHAIRERLKTPFPSSEFGHSKIDFANVAEYSNGLLELFLIGSDETFGSSNIIPNSLSIDFIPFKSLTKLILLHVRVSKIDSLGLLRSTLSHLTLNHSSLLSISEILLCDASEEKSDYVWEKLKILNLRFNSITNIDSSISYAPFLTYLYLNNNQISKIENLNSLSRLNVLELSFNAISTIENLHLKIGHVTRLNFSSNKISSLRGFSKLYSLVDLNVSGNRIRDIEEVYIGSNLPSLESLNLQGNQVTSTIDYRLKVFESVGKRCSELRLDNEAASTSEVDRVSVLMALRASKEGESPISLFGNLPKRL